MNDIIKLIENSDNIIITAHENEDADALGSCFALRRALSDMGKNAQCILSDVPERHLQFMEKNYTVFDSSDIPACDLCICLDCGSAERLGERRKIFDKALHTVSIDHHETNTLFAEANFVDKNAPATGEILYEFFEKMGVTVTEPIAENLYTAISADTGSFKYSNVRPRTMEIAAKLISCGINHSRISTLLHDTDPIEVIRFKAEIMNSIEQYAGGKLSVVTAKSDIFERFGISERDSGDIVNIARSVEGTEIAVSIRETADRIKISFRSNSAISVAEIAEKFGGGGHKKAAGASQKNKTIEEVKTKIITACEEVLNG